MEQPCYPLVQYLITHNVSSDQSPITVNRTNVTLYGVQPGETYTVKITPYLLNKKGDPHIFFFSHAFSCPVIVTTTCTATMNTTTPTTNTPSPSVTGKQIDISRDDVLIIMKKQHIQYIRLT